MTIFTKMRIFAIDVFLLSGLLAMASIYFFVPDIQKYNTELLNITKHSPNTNEVITDLDNDSIPEHFVFVEEEGFPVIRFKTGDYFQQIILQHNFVIRIPFFGDCNNDGVKEIAYLTKNRDSVFLNLLQFDGNLKYLVKNRFVDKVRKNHLGGFDIKNTSVVYFYDTNNDGFKDFVFQLLAEYSFQPRNLYIYDIANDELKKSPESGTYFTGLDTFDINRNGEIQLYFTSHTTSNVPTDWDNFQYHDTSAWLMVHNSDLSFSFPPVEFSGAGSITFPQLLITPDSNYIAVLHTNEYYKKNPILHLFDCNGRFLRKREFDQTKYNFLRMFSGSAPDFQHIYLFDIEGNIYILDKFLNEKRKIKLFDSNKNTTLTYTTCDLNNDKRKELVVITADALRFYGDDFAFLFDIVLEYPAFYNPEIYTENEQLVLFFGGSNKVYYQFAINENPYFNYRIAIYLGIFLALYFALFGLKFVWSKKLKYDNERLNQLIKRRTEEIAVQNKQLAKQNTKLKQNDEFKQAIAAMLVHDLKNPLMSIISFARKSYTKDNRKLEAYSQQMLALVMNILDTQKYENAKIKLNKQQNSIYKCAVSAISKLEILAQQRNIEIVNNINSAIIGFFDFDVIERVFINILSNAVKYTKRNSSISIDSHCINENEKIYCKITITDNGEGIPQEYLDNIFEKFTSENIKNYHYSTGLGLYYCKLMVEAHEGKIGVKTKMGKGSKFWFTLKGEMFDNKIDIKKADEKKRTDDTNKYSEKELQLIRNLSLEFKDAHFFEITKLNKILQQIDVQQNENVRKWKDRLTEAIELGNETMFNEMLNRY